MTKIIFLDIDGVLNNHLDSERHDIVGDDVTAFYSKRCIKHLNNLIKQTGAKIVVSSTWRLGQTVEQLQSTLNQMGVECEVLDKTKDLRCRSNDFDVYRGNEIYDWIKKNEDITGASYFKYRSYVILDDDTDMLLWQKDNFVNTDPEVGLTERGVFRAAAILNNSPCEDIGAEFQP